MAPARAPAIMKNTSLLNEKSILNLVAAVMVFLSICVFVIPLPLLFLLSLSKVLSPFIHNNHSNRTQNHTFIDTTTYLINVDWIYFVRVV